MSIHPPCEVLIRDESERERCATPEPVSYSPLSSPAHSPRPTIDEREWTKSSEIPFDEPQIRKQDSRIDRGSHIQPNRPFSLRWEEKKEDDPPFARIRSVLPVCERTRPSYYRFQDDDDEDEVPMDEPRTVELTPENSARFNVSSGNKPEPREPESSASSESEHDDIDSTEPGEIPISWGNEALGEDDSGVHLLATSSDLGRSYDTTALQFTLPEHGASTQVIDEDKEAEDEDSWLADEMGTSHKRDAIFDALNTSTDSKLADELGTSHKRDATFDALNTSIDSKDSSEPGSCQVTKTDPMEIIDSEEASGNEDKSEEGSRISERPDESTGDAHPPTPMCKVEFSLDSIEVVSSGASFHERECVISPESLEDHNNESGNSSSDPLPSTPPPPLEPELQSSEELVTDVLALDPCISLEVVETGVQTPQILDGDIEASYAENVSEEPLPSHSESEDAPVPEPSEAGSTCFDLRIDVEPSEIQEPTECTSELMSSHSRDMSVHDPSCAESRASVEDNLVALESESDESRCGDTSFEFGITAHLKKDASQASISPVKLLCVDGSFFDMPSAVDTSFDDPPSLLEEATTADEDESDSILGALPLQRATFSEDDESDTELIVSLESMVSEIDAMAQERAKKMDSPSTQNTTTNESFSKNSTNNIDQSISSSQIIGAWAEERAVKMELSGTQNAPIDDSFSMTATYKTDQSDSCMMRMSTSDAEQGKEKEITTVQNTATHESLPRVSNYAIDPEPLVGGLPALVNPLCNEIGIPRGDAFLSTLCTIGAESSWKEKVSEALWRARSMRRNYDFEWIRDNILRKDGEPSYTKVDVDHSKVAGDSCVEDMEVAAIQHLKFDELPDARGLCEDILHRYADIDEQMQQDEGKRADMRPFISVAAYNLGLIQMLEGKFELARHSMKRSLNTVSIDPSNKQGIDRQVRAMKSWHSFLT